MNLVWFRNDLRLTDNPALWHATDQGPSAGIFYLTPGQWQSHRMAGCRVDFILRSLKTLRAELAALGIPLLVRQLDSFADIPGDLLALCRKAAVRQVFWNHEYPLDEVVRDRAVAQALEGENIGVKRFHDRVIAAPGAVVKDDGEAYRVFTPFKKTWLRLLDQGLPELFPAPAPQAPLELETGVIPDRLAGFDTTVDAGLWPAGEAEAQGRLNTFINTALDHYHRDRDLPAVAGTSSLSPYLAIGSISPQQCLLAALAGPRGQGADTWIGELIWRDFYQHIVWHYPRVCRHLPFKEETDRVPWRDDRADLEAWQRGQTGVPLVDAGMRQLQRTGWMHNRVRMVVAMFLSKNLLLDWRLGEGYFMANLIDGDFPANNGGWQWSASTGTDAVPYFRIFNPFTQGQRFDPEARYIKEFVPELRGLAAADIHRPAHLAKLKPPGYGAPLVDLSRSRELALAAFRSL